MLFWITFVVLTNIGVYLCQTFLRDQLNQQEMYGIVYRLLLRTDMECNHSPMCDISTGLVEPQFRAQMSNWI